MNKIAVHPDTVHTISPIVFQNNKIPSFEDCKDLIRDLAYSRWVMYGKPEGRDLDIWLLAEFILFGTDISGGYRIYVMDRTKPLEDNFYYHYDAAIVTPDGLRLVNRRTWK